MLYPSNTAAPSVATEFVNGIKFDICEVVPQCYDLVYGKGNRFFLCAEDNIVGIDAAIEFHAKTGESRWDLFCGTKADMLNKIKQFQSDLETIEKWKNKPGFLAQQIVEKTISRCKSVYKVSPV